MTGLELMRKYENVSPGEAKAKASGRDLDACMDFVKYKRGIRQSIRKKKKEWEARACSLYRVNEIFLYIYIQRWDVKETYLYILGTRVRRNAKNDDTRERRWCFASGAAMFPKIPHSVRARGFSLPVNCGCAVTLKTKLLPPSGLSCRTEEEKEEEERGDDENGD